MNPTIVRADTETIPPEAVTVIDHLLRFKGPMKAWTSQDMRELNETVEKIERMFRYQEMREPPPRRFTRAWWKKWYRVYYIELHLKYNVRKIRRYAILATAFVVFDAGVAVGWHLHGARHEELQRERDLRYEVRPVSEESR